MCGRCAAVTVPCGPLTVPGDSTMYAILHGTNGRRHEVDFGDDPVVVEVSMSDVTVQITMTAPGDLDPNRARFVTVTVHESSWSRPWLKPSTVALNQAASLVFDL